MQSLGKMEEVVTGQARSNSGQGDAIHAVGPSEPSDNGANGVGGEGATEVLKNPRRTGEEVVQLPARNPPSPTQSESAIAVGPAKQESPGDSMFKKKQFYKSRTQSCQSVLSIASLKSVKRNSGSQPKQQFPAGSTISSASNSSAKDFQSFIQAPVLSNISNLKSGGEDHSIGQRLPFHNSSGARIQPENNRGSQAEGVTNTNQGDLSLDDRDTIIQQQRLTLNALKKLSLSPIPISDNGNVDQNEVEPRSATKLSDQPQSTDSYQPAQVDLSSFVSLTRQPKVKANSNLSSVNSAFLKDSPVKPLSEASLSNGDAERIEKKSECISQEQSFEKEKDNGINPEQKQQYDTGIQPSQKDDKERTNDVNATLKYHQDIHRNLLRRATNNSMYPTGDSKVSVSHFAPMASRGRPIANLARGNRNQVQPLNRNLQQIKGLRSPLYVPAVLRRTSPWSTPGSTKNDYPSPKDENQDALPKADSVNETGHNFHESANLKRSNTSFESFSSIATNDARTPSSLVTSPASGIAANDKSYENILKQAPTRRHWQKNETAYKCGMKSCNKVFNLFERRHHCRKCGGIYCKEHTSHYLYINHLAQFTTGGRGTLSKVCNNCIEEYNEFVKHEFGVDPSHSCTSTKDSVMSNESNLPYDPQNNERSSKKDQPSLVGNQSHIQSSNFADGASKPGRGEQIVGSIPANWSWSSF
ncbi:Piso0_000352 [Millerozyma farinosa CBS 7064]|uniref:Piso0_000352 protein n=1 Tax=Pichia sorbitophila (strain ATCC MYA-4447 / BCRC 22081 / CBS 7064 / NBRC 10061 / NRRL Y-12695) TaxID=559304 RepID=G8YTR8_PICSO|nr:Piso0_000352 [Millerozyma farinosa CBS 7064]CCE73319.1 Piso0_000352 [Millerozyma farinosa CBS 7064]